MNRNILVLGAGQEQCIAINEAQALGYTVVACDADPDAIGLKLADYGITCDIRNVDLLVSIGNAHSIQGIFCHAVEIPEVVAKVAKILGLPGLEPEIANKCTNKINRIETLTAAKIPCARFESASSFRELVRIGERFGFPLVLKPIDNAGSRGVKIVQSASDLKQAYDEAMEYSNASEVLVEQVLNGPQISTESVVYKGNVTTFAFADRNYESPELYYPYFIENGINFPTVLPKEQVKAVLALVDRTIEALGIDYGAAKGDIIIHNGVPHVIEMASRTSGGWFGAGSIPKATGVNALKPLLQMSVGEIPDLNTLIPTRQLACAQRYWIPKQRAIIHEVLNLDNIEQMEGVKMFNSFFPPMGTIIEKATHNAQRYAQVICTAPTRDRAIELAVSAIDAINVEMTLL